MTYKVHIDGYNMLPYFTGKVEESPRKEMYYFTDDGSLSAFRYEDWKLMFSVQERHGFDVWRYPLTELRLPYIFNLRRDPFERAYHESSNYDVWHGERFFLMVPAMSYIGKFLTTFKEYPQRQEVGTFNLDKVMKQLSAGSGSGN